MNAEEFVAWLKEMNLNDAEATRRLGLGSRNTLVGYKSNGAPQYIALACAALAAGLPKWTRLASTPEGRSQMYSVRHQVEDRERNVLSSEVMPIGFQTEEEVKYFVERQQASFDKGDFDGMHARWWARNDGGEFRLHYWWKEQPVAGHHA